MAGWNVHCFDIGALPPESGSGFDGMYERHALRHGIPPGACSRENGFVLATPSYRAHRNPTLCNVEPGCR